MTASLDTLRTFGSRFAMTGTAIATPLYDAYQARDHDHAIDVGLWIPHATLFASADARARLAAATAEIRAVIHPRLRRLFAVGDAPAPWISLQPAHPHAVAGAVPRAQLLGWIDVVAGALRALHGAGLVHGGVLAHDVVVVDGELRLGGGGIWACAEPRALAQLAASAAIAPERRAGGPATPTADGWSLAALIAGWAGGRDHPALAAALAPMLADDPGKRPGDLGVLVAGVRSALAAPFTDEAPAPTARPRGRVRKATAEEKTTVGHASGPTRTAPVPDHDDAPTVRSAPPVAPREEPAPVAPAPTATRAPTGVPRAIDEIRSAPILAVSMMPGGAAGRPYEPLPPPPTPQLQRPNLRPSTRDDASASLGRLAPPRATVIAQRREARRTWLIVALSALIAVVVGIIIALVG